MGNYSYRNAILCLAAVTALSACTSQKTNGNKVDTMNISALRADVSLTTPQKSEKFAAIAEQLFTLTNFMHSYDMAEMALELDAGNKKAQFYKNLSGLYMNLKGMAVRLKPLLNEAQKVKLEQDMQNFPDSALKTFLLDGQEDMKTSKDVQKFIDAYISSLNDLRVFMKSNKDIEITLNANDWSWASFLDRSNKECIAKYDTGHENIEEIQCPHNKDSGKVKLNAADMEALQLAFGGYQVLLSFYNAYDITGLQELGNIPETQRLQMSSSQTWTFLSQFSDFGVYRASAQREKMIEMGLDFILATRWAVKAQKELCKEGVSSLKNRPGYLFNTGICTEIENQTQHEKDLALAEFVLNGGLIPLNVNGGDEKVMGKPAFFFTHPVQDLKALKPVFKRCDNDPSIETLISIADPTLNGMVPGGELNAVLQVSHVQECTWGYMENYGIAK